MRLTGSGAYTLPAPAPRMPAGLVELMEDLTRDVLKQNPPNVHEFCANHMAKLLEIRDGRAPKQILTLEQKIAKAQQKIRERAAQRRQKYDLELELQSRKNDIKKSFDTEIKAVEETTLENTFKTPIHHEQDLADALEVEIFHKSNDDKKNNDETPRILNEEPHVEGKQKEVEMESKCDDTIKEFNHHNIAPEGSALKQQIENPVEVILSEADDIFGNPKVRISDHARKRRSIDSTEENFAKSAELCKDDADQITNLTKDEIKYIADTMVREGDIINMVDDSENVVKASEANGDKIIDETMERVDFNVDSVQRISPKHVDGINEKLDKSINDTIEDNVDNVVETVDKHDKFIDETTEKAEKIVDLTMEQIYHTVEETEENVDNSINESTKEIDTILDVTQEKISDVMDATTEEIAIVLNATDQKVDNIAHVTEQVVENVVDTGIKNVDNIVDTNEEIVKNGGDATGEIIDSVVDANIEKVDNIVNATKGEISNNIDTTETIQHNVADTEVYKVESIAEVAEEEASNVADTTEGTVENARDITVEQYTSIADTIEEVAKNVMDTTNERVDDVIDTAEININDVVDAIKEKVDVPHTTSQTNANVENTTVENVDALKNITVEKLIDGKNVSYENLDNSADTTEQNVDTDGKNVELIVVTDGEKVKNSVNITKQDAKNLDNVDDNENQVESFEHNTDQKGHVIVANSAGEDLNISNASEQTIDDVVRSIEEEDDKTTVTAIKLIEENSVGDDGISQVSDQKMEVDKNDSKTVNENGIEIPLISSETYFENGKEPRDLQTVHIAQISGIVVPVKTNDINSDSVSYLEINEEPCIKSNVIELTVVGNGNIDNDAVNEIINKDSGKIESKEKELTPELVSLNTEDTPDQAQSKRHEKNSDTENISNVSEPEQLEIDTTSIGKHSSMDDSTIGDSNDSILELDAMKNMDETSQNIHSPNTMDLETAAVTIQKVFRTFLFKSRGSTFDDTANEEHNLIDDNEKEEIEFPITSANLTKERRALGISRMDTVLQTVNEEKSLSLSTDDSSTLSSAATIIQAHVRGFLVRNKLNFYKTTSSASVVNSDEPQSLEVDTDQQKKNKTVLNIHIVPEGEHFLSRDESMMTSMDLSLDGSPPSSTNLHPLGYDKNERRKQLKREDAIQSMSPPSNNSGKLSDEVDSGRDILINETLEKQTSPSVNEPHEDTNKGSRDTSPTISTTIDTVIETQKISNSPEVDKENSAVDKRKRLKKMNSDEADVVTPFVSHEDEDKDSLTDSDNTSRLLHSGEFHDVVPLPTKVSRNDTSVARGE